MSCLHQHEALNFICLTVMPRSDMHTSLLHNHTTARPAETVQHLLMLRMSAHAKQQPGMHA